MLGALKHMFDMETAKMMGAASVPFAVWGLNLELGLKIGTEVVVFAWVCIKFVRYLQSPEK